MLQTSPSVVRTLPLFAGLSEQEKDKLIQGGKVRRLSSGQNLFACGDPVRTFAVVCEGAVQLFRETPDGHEMTADVLIAGDTIGETEILQFQNSGSAPIHQFNAIAVKETALMEFPVSWLKENSKRYSMLALNLLATLSRRVQIATVEAEHKSTMSAAQQITCFLERLCVLHGFDPNGFDLPYSKTLIASRLGMELETFSRALAKIRNHGISVEGSHVAFQDIRKIEEFVCSNCSVSGHCDEHEELKEELQSRKSGKKV